MAAYDQGAHVTYLGPGGSHMGHKETVKDTARVLGRMYDAIEYRGFGQEVADELASERVRADAASFNLDTAEGTLGRLVRRYETPGAAASTGRPQDLEKPLADYAPAEAIFDIVEPAGDLPEDHVFGDPGDLRDHLDDIVAADFPPPIDFRLHGGGVQPADDLVRKLEMAHVAGRHLQSGLDRFVLDPH